MLPNSEFLKQPKSFWAHVKSISQKVGYTKRGGENGGEIKVPTIQEITNALTELGLKSDHVADKHGKSTKFGELLVGYFQHRADVLNNYVRPRLMDVNQAKEEFEKLYKKLSPKCPIPMNKQKGDKKTPSYLTGMVNMLMERYGNQCDCDYDPKKLTAVTKDGVPFRTLSRRLDGAFPSTVNPIAIWEVKEYYYTTTFGSRVADGVYETLVDGVELEELKEHGIHIRHYLMVDDSFTWWVKGRSYLCRIIDMLHMGYIDEVFFGRELLERWPTVVKELVSLLPQQKKAAVASELP